VEAVFARSQQAAKAGDWETYLACLTDQTRDEMLGGLIFGSGMAALAGGDEANVKFEALMAGFGVEAVEGEAADDPTQAFVNLAGQVENKAACWRALLAWMESHGQPLDFDEETTLGAVERNGDAAVAQVTLKRRDGSSETMRWKFAKVNGAWLLAGDATQ
jgi:hypothetical protein